MFQHSILRPMIGMPLAALVVFGLFTFMQKMVTRDFEIPEAVPQRVLETFVHQKDYIQPPVDRPPVQPLPAANQPPPPPKFSATKSDVHLPTPLIEGSAPAELPRSPFKGLELGMVAVNDHEAKPIRPPVPSYPSSMASRGIEGHCDVRLDVDVRGRPFNVDASCSNSGFEREAERAVNRVEFIPKIVRGQAVERRGVVYPIEFTISG